MRIVSKIELQCGEYSSMKIVHPPVLSVAEAEQERSESGFYSEENAVEIGKMTNANLVAAGSVQKIADSYELNFRVNDTETNEVKAAFNSRYSLSQMQDGTAVNETTRAILEGLGVELTDSERAALEKTNKLQNSSAMNLAKGSAAEKNGNLFDALLAYTQVDGNLKTEAQSNVKQMLNGDISGLSVTEKIRKYEEESEKWNKVFDAWYDYLKSGNWFFCVYDFSNVQDKVDFKSSGTSVDFTITPGVKIVPKREAVLLHKQIFDSWEAVRSQPENKEWVKGVRTSSTMATNRASIEVQVDLMNEYGVVIDKVTYSFYFAFTEFFESEWSFFKTSKILTQHNYYDAVDFKQVLFRRIDAKNITDTITPAISKVSQCNIGVHYHKISVPVLSVSEAAALLE